MRSGSKPTRYKIRDFNQCGSIVYFGRNNLSEVCSVIFINHSTISYKNNSTVFLVTDQPPKPLSESEHGIRQSRVHKGILFLSSQLLIICFYYRFCWNLKGELIENKKR